MRGRRVVATPDAKRKFSALSLLAVPLLILGIFVAMLLSALSTQQTFTIQQLQSQERDLNNHIETLNRDLEDSKAAAEVAARANAAGLVLPGAPGIINVDREGRAHETREADPAATTNIVDVNAETIRVDQATSDRDATRDVVDNLSARPQEAQRAGFPLPSTAPGANGPLASLPSAGEPR